MSDATTQARRGGAVTNKRALTVWLAARFMCTRSVQDQGFGGRCAQGPATKNSGQPARPVRPPGAPPDRPCLAWHMGAALIQQAGRLPSVTPAWHHHGLGRLPTWASTPRHSSQSNGRQPTALVALMTAMHRRPPNPACSGLNRDIKRLWPSSLSCLPFIMEGWQWPNGAHPTALAAPAPVQQRTRHQIDLAK
jgi:hypothetical protein